MTSNETLLQNIHWKQLPSNFTCSHVGCKLDIVKMKQTIIFLNVNVFHVQNLIECSIAFNKIYKDCNCLVYFLHSEFTLPDNNNVLVKCSAKCYVNNNHCNHFNYDIDLLLTLPPLLFVILKLTEKNSQVQKKTQLRKYITRNSSGNEIANVNFFTTTS